MICTSPVKIYPPQLGTSSVPFRHLMEVPCGKCPACRMRKASEWRTRLLMENDFSHYSYFVTLTYDNDHLPEGANLCPEDLQKFFKRFRKSRIINEGLKYYAVGEYGKNLRPHYHAIMLGFSYPVDDDVLRYHKIPSWPCGRVSFDTVTSDSIGYVTGYVNKRSGYVGDRVPPFSRMSQGIGLRGAVKLKARIVDEFGISIDGRNCGLPKYFVDKFSKMFPDIDFKELVRKHSLESRDNSRFTGFDFRERNYLLKRERETREAAINTRLQRLHSRL